MTQIASPRALIGIAAGLSAQATGAAVTWPAPAELALGFVAGALLVYGCSIAARDKGYSPWVGFIGVFSFVGVGLLLLVPGPRYFRFFRYLRDRGGPRVP